MNFLYLLHRELIHGHCCNTGPLYEAPMVDVPDTQFLVGDFVSVYWAQKEVITAKIIRFYTMVRSFNIHCI